MKTPNEFTSDPETFWGPIPEDDDMQEWFASQARLLDEEALQTRRRLDAEYERESRLIKLSEKHFGEAVDVQFIRTKFSPRDGHPLPKHHLYVGKPMIWAAFGGEISKPQEVDGTQRVMNESASAILGISPETGRVDTLIIDPEEVGRLGLFRLRIRARKYRRRVKNDLARAPQSVAVTAQ